MWPSSLSSLANVSLASLLYQYWHDRLDLVPLDRKNYAQRDALQAIKIANKCIDCAPPPIHTVTNENAKAKWREDAQKLAAATQDRVLQHLNCASTTQSSSNNTRIRRRTGVVTGIVRAFTQIHRVQRPALATETAIHFLSTEVTPHAAATTQAEQTNSL